MIKEPIKLEPQYFELSDQIIEEIHTRNLLKEPQLVIGICGESGCGKTVTAQCLQKQLEKAGKKTHVLHMDSYFWIPPKDNHLKRKGDIQWVGPQEVNIHLMETHLNLFKKGVNQLQIPIVDYENNRFDEMILEMQDVSVVIVEGVYAFHIDGLDLKIFLEKNYLDTLETRKERSREVYDTFVEQVLEIEHHLALNQKLQADLLVDKNYHLKHA